MRKIIIAALLCGCAVQAGAADGTNSNRPGSGMNIEQKKSEIIQHIQDRISNSQAELICVKSAASHEEFKSCHEKYRPSAPKNERRNHEPQQ